MRINLASVFVDDQEKGPAVKPFKEALVADGISYTSFAVDDLKAEYERLRGLGVRFTQEPADIGPVTSPPRFKAGPL